MTVITIRIIFKWYLYLFFQGSLSRADFEQCLRSFFPLKDDESIEVLMKACEQESPGENVQYKNLFTEVRRSRNVDLVNETSSRRVSRIILNMFFFFLETFFKST